MGRDRAYFMSKELIELGNGNGAPLVRRLGIIAKKAKENTEQYVQAHPELNSRVRDIYIIFLKQELSDYFSWFKLDDEEIDKYYEILKDAEFSNTENDKYLGDALTWLTEGIRIQSTKTVLSKEEEDSIKFLKQINQSRVTLLKNVYVECFQRPHENYAQHLSSELEKECQQWRCSDYEPIPQTEIDTMVRQIKEGKEVTLSVSFQNGIYDKDLTENISKIVDKANLNAKVLRAGDDQLKRQGITEINAPIDYYKIKLEESAKLSTPEYLAKINEDRHSAAHKVIKGFELFVKFIAALVTQSGLGLEDIAKEIDNREKREKISTGVEKFKEIKSSLDTLKSECSTEVADTDLSSQGLTVGNS